MTRSVADMILDDRDNGLFRVNQAIFTDPAIFEQERDSVWNRTWLYACHESEIGKPGSFVSRKVAGRPIIITKNKEGAIKGFFNACTHRGKEVCMVKKGEGTMFRCFYHSWVFDLNGDLVALPGPEAYSEAWDRKAMGLRPVPRIDNYRGMIFVSYDPGIQSLESYLGNVREYIDLMLDFSETENEIVDGEQNYSIRANWKLLVENSFDSYHGLPTHSRFFGRYIGDITPEDKTWDDVTEGGSMGGKAIALGNGHALTQNPARTTPLQIKAGPEMKALKARLVEKYGQERADRIANFNRNVLIFPNTFIIAYWRTVRTFYPVSPDYMEINAWCLLPKDEPEKLRKARLENFISFLGPGGFGTPDDMIALEGCQRGYASRANQPEWSDISRGMKQEQKDSTGELQMRSFWRQYRAMMTNQSAPVDFTDNPVKVS